MKLAANNFPLPKLSDKEMINLLKKARNLQMDLAAWGMAVAFADIYGEISDKIMKIFSCRKDLKHPINYYLNVLSNSSQASLTAQAYEDIYLSRNDKNLQNKYFWIDQGYIGRGLDLKQIKNIRRHYKIVVETAESEKTIIPRTKIASGRE